MLGVQAVEQQDPAVASEDALAGIQRTDIHEVLSNERRIRLLRLLRTESPRTLGELAEEIAAAETGEYPPPRNKRQSAYVTLHQTHLPKLDSLGIVEYDAREKVVDLQGTANVLFEDEESTERADAGVEPWLVLVLAGLGTSLASMASLPPFGALAPTTYALGTLVALLVCFAYRLGRDGSTLLDRVRAR